MRRDRLTRWLVIALIAVAVIAWTTIARAQTPLSLSVTSDIRHAPGLSSWALRYGDEWGLRAGAIVMPTTKVRGVTMTETVGLIGVDRRWRVAERLSVGLGAAWISDTTLLNGTRLNLDLSATWRIAGGAFIEFRHYSHGSMLGIGRGKPNKGWNLVGIGYEWR